MGLVVEKIYVWCPVIVAIFVGFGQAGAKSGGNASHKRGALFIGKACSHYVMLLHCETVLQILLGIYCERSYWIPDFTILLFCFMCLRLAKPKVQLEVSK